MRGKSLEISPLDDKSWPVERWAELLRRVHAHMPDAAIVLCGAPRETLLLEWIDAAVNLPKRCLPRNCRWDVCSPYVRRHTA